MVLFLVNNLCAKLEQFQHFQYFQHIVLYKIYDSFCQNMMYNKESIHQRLLPLQSCLSLPREAGSVPQSGFNGFCGSPGAPDDREAEQKQSSANRKLSQI